jgi:hypothetical protein
MGVFDRFTSEKKGTGVEVSPEVYETQDFGEGIVSGKSTLWESPATGGTRH